MPWHSDKIGELLSYFSSLTDNGWVVKRRKIEPPHQSPSNKYLSPDGLYPEERMILEEERRRLEARFPYLTQSTQSPSNEHPTVGSASEVKPVIDPTPNRRQIMEFRGYKWDNIAERWIRSDQSPKPNLDLDERKARWRWANELPLPGHEKKEDKKMPRIRVKPKMQPQKDPFDTVVMFPKKPGSAEQENGQVVEVLVVKPDGNTVKGTAEFHYYPDAPDENKFGVTVLTGTGATEQTTSILFSIGSGMDYSSWLRHAIASSMRAAPALDFSKT